MAAAADCVDGGLRSYAGMVWGLVDMWKTHGLPSGRDITRIVEEQLVMLPLTGSDPARIACAQLAAAAIATVRCEPRRPVVVALSVARADGEAAA